MKAGFGDEAAPRHRFAEAQDERLLRLVDSEDRDKDRDDDENDHDDGREAQGAFHLRAPSGLAVNCGKGK